MSAFLGQSKFVRIFLVVMILTRLSAIGYRLRPTTTVFRVLHGTTTANAVLPERRSELLSMQLPSNDNSADLLKIRHTASHVLAMAVQRLYPGVKVTIGPWIENGCGLVCVRYRAERSLTQSPSYVLLCNDDLGFTTISLFLVSRSLIAI